MVARTVVHVKRYPALARFQGWQERVILQGLAEEFRLDAIKEEELQERLIGNVAFVCQSRELINSDFGKRSEMVSVDGRRRRASRTSERLNCRSRP